MKSIEELTLSTVTRDPDLRKVYKEWGKYGKYDEPVLIDRCQYWKRARGHEDDEYYIMMRYWVKLRGWELCLYNKENFLFSILCNGFQLNMMTENMWMTTQHLRIDYDDGKNIPWKLGDAWRWWRNTCRQAGMYFNVSKPKEHELHFVKEEN